MLSRTLFLASAFCFSVFALLQGCSKSSGGAGINLPLLTPPVQAAAPKAFGGKATPAAAMALTNASLVRDFFSMGTTRDAIIPSDFATRFFQSGPTDIYNILGSIDGRITGINTQSAGSTAACLTQTPVSYTITPFGQSVAMFGQCYEIIGTNGLVQWGVKAGVTYLWVQVGAGDLAAIATPVTGSTTGAYTVQAWATVGNAGTFNSNGTTSANWATIGSYGVMQLQADSTKTNFEMVAAGTSIGYCGVHFMSDGTNIYGEGSTDMGTTCNTSTPICVLATDGTTPVTPTSGCTVQNTAFALTSIGRKAATSGSGAGTQTFGASAYPATPNITLDGSSTDSLSFGPTVFTPGVGLFASSSAAELK